MVVSLADTHTRLIYHYKTAMNIPVKAFCALAQSHNKTVIVTSEVLFNL